MFGNNTGKVKEILADAASHLVSFNVILDKVSGKGVLEKSVDVTKLQGELSQLNIDLKKISRLITDFEKKTEDLFK